MPTYGGEFQLSTMTGRDGVKILGERKGDQAGISVLAAGDVNGDGIDDNILGASSANINAFSSGAAHVLLGQTEGFTGVINLSALNRHYFRNAV